MRDTRYRRRKLGTQALEKILRRHDRWCTHYTVMGNGRCSCGRNQAIAELRVLQRRIAALGRRECVPDSQAADTVLVDA